MSVLTAIIAVSTILYCFCVDGQALPNEHGSIAAKQSSGAEITVREGPDNVDVANRQSYNSFSNPSHGSNYRPSQNKRKCPLCDSSVYPYCSEKLLHDACCCTDPYDQPLPYQCQLADCAFLHANSCKEHKLIANCCCSDQYRSLLRG